MTIKIGITGAAGRMGRTLIEAIDQSSYDIILAAALEQPESSLVGADAGELAGMGKNGVVVVGALSEVIDQIDVLIDFTVPAATVANAKLCSQHGKNMVIGTTGFSIEQENQLDAAIARIA
ncbi:MAG: 4-hydroxy-tetrahydrodipicolinate reductase, partial [Halioglobus sp.]